MNYLVKLAIYAKNRKGDSKMECCLTLGEMSMDSARVYVGNLVKNNASKKFVTTYEETLFSQSDTCDQNCAECPLSETCVNSIFNP